MSGTASKPKAQTGNPRSSRGAMAKKPANGTTVPRSGLLFLAAVGIILLPAYWLSVNLIFLIAAMFTGIWIYNWLWTRVNLLRVTVMPLALPDLFADQEARLTLQVKNAKSWLAAHFIELHLETPETRMTTLPVRVHQIGPGSTVEVPIETRPLKRGWARIGGYRMSSGYPFGLVFRTRTVAVSNEVLIYPGLLDGIPARLRAEQQRKGLIPNNTDDYQYLTGYQPGDDVRRIHWRKSTLLESPVLKKDLVRIEDMEPTLFVPDPCPHFEYALSALTTFFHHRNLFTAWAILTEDGIEAVENRVDMLRRLALVRPLRQKVDAYRLAERYRPLLASELKPDEMSH